MSLPTRVRSRSLVPGPSASKGALSRPAKAGDRAAAEHGRGVGGDRAPQHLAELVELALVAAKGEADERGPHLRLAQAGRASGRCIVHQRQRINSGHRDGADPPWRAWRNTFTGIKWRSRGYPRPFPSRRPVLVREPSRRADRAAGRRLAAHPRRPQRPDRGAHRLRQDAGRRSCPPSTACSGRAPTCPPQTQVVYVSPLRALVQRHPEEPAGAAGGDPRAAIRRCPRSACSSAPATRRRRERTAMAKKPPHILVTTPESLYLLLTSRLAAARCCRPCAP